MLKISDIRHEILRVGGRATNWSLLLFLSLTLFSPQHSDDPFEKYYKAVSLLKACKYPYYIQRESQSFHKLWLALPITFLIFSHTAYLKLQDQAHLQLGFSLIVPSASKYFFLDIYMLNFPISFSLCSNETYCDNSS